jgi:hypothetical protein
MFGPSTGTQRCFELDEDRRPRADPVSMMVSGDLSIVEDRWETAAIAALNQGDNTDRRPPDRSRFTLLLLPNLARDRQ